MGELLDAVATWRTLLAVLIVREADSRQGDLVNGVETYCQDCHPRRERTRPGERDSN